MKLEILNCESTNRLTSVAIYSVGQQLCVLQAGARQLAHGRGAAYEEEAAWRGPGHVVTATLHPGPCRLNPISGRDTLFKLQFI